MRPDPTPEQVAAVTAARTDMNRAADIGSRLAPAVVHRIHAHYVDACTAAGLRPPPALADWPGIHHRIAEHDPTDSDRFTVGAQEGTTT